MPDAKPAVEPEVVLHYTGNHREGTPYFLGVPARDLTDDDVAGLTGERWGKTRPTVIKRLTESSLYTEAAPESATADKKEK